MKKRIFITFFGLILSSYAFSQEFKAKVIVGAGASQIDGDGYGGYNQLGGILGFATSFPISEKINLQQEIVYYGRGSRKKVNVPISDDFTVLGLHYADLDLVFNYYASDKIIVNGGAGYGILMFDWTDASYQDPFRPDIFGFIGVGYLIQENIELNVRWQNSVRTFHKSINPFHSNSLNFTARFILGNN